MNVLLERHYVPCGHGFVCGADGMLRIVLSLMLSLGAASAQDKTYTMKITLPTLNDPSHIFAKDYAEALEKDSGGRIKPQIFPLSQLGSIPRQIEGTQFGSIQCALIPPEFFVGVDERFEVHGGAGPRRFDRITASASPPIRPRAS